MGNTLVSPSVSHRLGKCNKIHCIRKIWEIGFYAVPILWILFSHPISIVRYTLSHEKCNKTHRMLKTCETGIHTFPIVWVLFPIRFPRNGMLHHMRNAWVCPSTSHSMGKSNKTHPVGRTWEIGTHTFQNIGDFLPSRFPSCVVLHHMRN